MINKSWLLIPAALVMAGCATCDTKVADLETRVRALESRSSISVGQKEAQAETSVSGETTKAAEEVTAPDSPTKKDIQASLKSAGFYTGEVDGKMGSKTKKAIEEFQSANALVADGKVGPNTWNKLKQYYVAEKTENAATQTK
jgi:peptidoglycan hydrolase-like protein with peptidoglycan-binding domain